jgi:hypothetical protein
MPRGLRKRTLRLRQVIEEVLLDASPSNSDEEFDLLERVDALADAYRRCADLTWTLQRPPHELAPALRTLAHGLTPGAVSREEWERAVEQFRPPAAEWARG